MNVLEIENIRSDGKFAMGQSSRYDRINLSVVDASSEKGSEWHSDMTYEGEGVDAFLYGNLSMTSRTLPTSGRRQMSKANRLWS